MIRSVEVAWAEVFADWWLAEFRTWVGGKNHVLKFICSSVHLLHGWTCMFFVC